VLTSYISAAVVTRLAAADPSPDPPTGGTDDLSAGLGGLPSWVNTAGIVAIIGGVLAIVGVVVGIGVMARAKRGNIAQAGSSAAVYGIGLGIVVISISAAALIVIGGIVAAIVAGG
jgi:hypothetical protein